MKNTLTFVFSLFFASQILAQAYEPMAVEGAHWVMYSISQEGPDHHTLVICGDTTMNGVEYKKMYREHLTSQATLLVEFQPPYYSDEVTLIGAIRDDVGAREVYFVAFEDNYFLQDTCETFQDVLIHEFSKTEGDTLGGCLHSYSPNGPVVVTSMQTEFIFGQERKVWYSDNAFARLVETVGTDIGPLWPLPVIFVPKYPQILVDYFVVPEETCPPQILTSTVEQEPWPGFAISPNPASDRLAVSLPTSLTEHFTLTISDFMGKNIWQKDFSTSDVLTFPLENLPKGTYLLTLQTDEQVITRKFLKN